MVPSSSLKICHALDNPMKLINCSTIFLKETLHLEAVILLLRLRFLSLESDQFGVKFLLPLYLISDRRTNSRLSHTSGECGRAAGGSCHVRPI
jgi:hypothetical protein